MAFMHSWKQAHSQRRVEMELCSVVTRITPGRTTANRDQHTALPHALPPYGSTAVLGVVFKTDRSMETPDWLCLVMCSCAVLSTAQRWHALAPPNSLSSLIPDQPKLRACFSFCVQQGY